MKKILYSILGISLIFATFAYTPARAQDTTPPEPDSGAVVCEPGVYLTTPDDCLPLGPSAYLTDLARLGMTFPPRPQPAAKPDPRRTQLPDQYLHQDDTNVPG
jgi:hypothetical protein